MKKDIISGVYFILNNDNKLIKIGCSKNILKRYNELQSDMRHLGLSEELSLLGYIDCEDYFKLEKHLHKKFKKYKVLNEWYSIKVDDVSSVIKNINTRDFLAKNNSIQDKKAFYRYCKDEEIYEIIGYVNTNKLVSVLMKLSSNEKLVYYILRDFVQYPTNFVVIADTLPTTKQLEKLVGLSEKSIIGALKSLEDKKIIKRKQVGHKKAIVINPDYYASGKDLEVDTLAMFGLIEVREDIIDTYLEELKIK